MFDLKTVEMIASFTSALPNSLYVSMELLMIIKDYRS